jgi:3-deoxy-manno-octulosonate cytidylyltransferase (CMP-KDO synthetase)
LIIHVFNRARESEVGEVFVATPDAKIVSIVEENGGQAVLTKRNYSSGSDRIYEVYLKKLKNNVDLIINLQGDMPNIKPNSISKLEKLMRKNNCPIGTLASSLNEDEIYEHYVVKVEVDEDLKEGYKHLLKNKRMEGLIELVNRFIDAFHSFIFK